MSMFAYSKMISAIKSRAEKMGIVVFEVNPAYKSQIGKLKYMKRFGISTHKAASFVIACRADEIQRKVSTSVGHIVTREDNRCSSLGAVEVSFKSAEGSPYAFVLSFRSF